MLAAAKSPKTPPKVRSVNPIHMFLGIALAPISMARSTKLRRRRDVDAHIRHAATPRFSPRASGGGASVAIDIPHHDGDVRKGLSRGHEASIFVHLVFCGAKFFGS